MQSTRSVSETRLYGRFCSPGGACVPEPFPLLGLNTQQGPQSPGLSASEPSRVQAREPLSPRGTGASGLPGSDGPRGCRRPGAANPPRPPRAAGRGRRARPLGSRARGAPLGLISIVISHSSPSAAGAAAHRGSSRGPRPLPTTPAAPEGASFLEAF